MKSTLVGGLITPATYPKLMINKIYKNVVLFTGPDTGTCVHTGDSVTTLGFTSRNWGTDQYENFTGKVTLEN